MPAEEKKEKMPKFVEPQKPKKMKKVAPEANMFWQSVEDLEKEKREAQAKFHMESRVRLRVPADEVAMPKLLTEQGTCCPLIAEQMAPSAELHPCTQEQWRYVDPQTGWTRIRAVVDSGASDSCASDEMEPDVKSVESAGSRRGVVYNAATPGVKPLTNNGQKEIMMLTTEGRMLGTCWQTVEVARPLLSVRQITAQGNRVVFGRIGGEIQNLQSGQVVKFGMEGNVYVLDLWIPPKTGFTRRGA